MKVLVYQCQIGERNLISNNKSFYEFQKNICMPSVQKWAIKYGYDYQLITESTLLNNGFYTGDNVLPKLYSTERIMHMYNESYDYVLYLDSDIYISPFASEFRFIKGISCCKDIRPELEESKFIIENTEENFFKKYNTTGANYNYYNFGVFAIDKETAKSFKEYALDRYSRKVNINPFNNDQDFLNHWQLSNKTLFNTLDYKWNFYTRNIPKSPDTNFKEIYFFHFLHNSKKDKVFMEEFSHIKKMIAIHGGKIL